ncbi:hypothetical protein HYDPIDRAFT_118065 [Hydnomerulius pinastri MD-312]|uniref:Uncharacterized protein n=1 Tax=Hydnomerulius pinastri MD-312 TaxID=994086 RepID=A0A0C9VQ37_9AGAM|nr:hypothetical protein HYDPIDRAFT_118065 [Hydnomerulius pinastri MD-312]
MFKSAYRGHLSWILQSPAELRFVGCLNIKQTGRLQLGFHPFHGGVSPLCDGHDYHVQRHLFTGILAQRLCVYVHNPYLPIGSMLHFPTSFSRLPRPVAISRESKSSVPHGLSQSGLLPRIRSSLRLLPFTSDGLVIVLSLRLHTIGPDNPDDPSQTS